MDRKKLKAWAKAALGRNYWKSVIVALLGFAIFFVAVYTVWMGLGMSFGYGMSMLLALGAYLIDTSIMSGESVTMSLGMMAFLVIIGLGIFAIGFAGKAFLGNTLGVGCKRFFLDGLYKKDVNLGQIGSAFKPGYKNIAKTLFVRDIYLGLWIILSTTIYMILSMVLVFVGIYAFVDHSHKFPEIILVLFIVLGFLFIYVIMFISYIPAYIKLLQYLYMPYILAENPDMPTKQVFELSKKMICGEKWNVFVMHLSFLGWVLLSSYTCGILQLFYVGPYIGYTTAAYYEATKQKTGNPQIKEIVAG